MINLSDILTSLQSQFNNTAALVSLVGAGQIEIGTFINMDPNQTPWIGLYPGIVSYVPRTLGMDNNWEGSPKIRIVCQAADIYDSLEATNKLNELVKTTIDALTSDITIGGSVDMVNSFDIEYGYVESERTSLHFQSAIITVQLEVSAQ